MITISEIKEQLEKEFIGKDYRTYSTGYDVALKAKELLVAAGLDEHDLSIDTKHQHVEVLYKRRSLIMMDIKKTKAKTHNNFYGRYCDWTVAGINIVNLDILDTIKLLDESAAKEDAKNNLKITRARETLKYLMTTYNISVYAAAEIAKEVSSHYYLLLLHE